MEEKKCCGIYDYDGVLVPGEELMDYYIEPVCKEATNAYGEGLFRRQLELTLEKQRLEQDRDIYGSEMLEIEDELEDEFGDGRASTGAFSVIHEFRRPHMKFISSSYNFWSK